MHILYSNKFTKKVSDPKRQGTNGSHEVPCVVYLPDHTAISIRVVPEQSGKVECEHEKLSGSDD